MGRREQQWTRANKGCLLLGLFLFGWPSGEALAADPASSGANSAGALAPRSASLPRWENTDFPGVPANPPRLAHGGDVNGDGFDDLAIGAPLDNQGKGVVAVFYGGAAGLRERPDWRVDGQIERAQFGGYVSFGDFNGDGISDLTVASRPSGPEAGEGWIVELFYGSADGLAAIGQPWLPNRLGPLELREGLRVVGDVNGDGVLDFACPGVSHERGANFPPLNVVLVFHGSNVGLTTSPAAILRSEQDGSNFAAPVEGVGDVNGDGYDDVCIGAYTYTGRYHRGGKAYLYLGGPEGIAPEPAWASEYPLKGMADEKNQHFGLGLGSAGDVNGDGYADILVGAAFASHGEINEGAVFLYLGSEQGLGESPAWQSEANQPHAMFGYWVGAATDLNRDGFSDILIGAPQAEHGQKDEGVALVFYGGRQGLGKRPAWTFDGDRTSGRMGTLVADAGDLNGDGLHDLLIAGQYLENLAGPVKSRIVVQYGTPGGPQNSSNWRIEKPFLAAAQQWLDRTSSEQLWFGCTAVAASAIVVLLYLQRRLRARVAALMHRNRELALAEERARLARDVHDHLGADLTHLAVELDRVRETAPESTRDRLANLSGFAGRLGNAVRELVWATNPERDTLDDAASFLSEQASSFLEAHGIPCDLDFPLQLPPRRISSALRHNLLLMLKEALHNIVQHAHATRVYVVLRAEDGSVRLEIRDDGEGIQKPAQAGNENGNGNGAGTREAGRHRGLGLRNLHLRAAELGGTVTISAEPGQGTRILIVVPMPGPGFTAGADSMGPPLRNTDPDL